MARAQPAPGAEHPSGGGLSGRCAWSLRHGPSPIAGGSGGRSPAEAVRAFAESFFEGAAPALITVLNRAVTVKVLGADLVSPGDVPTRIVRP